MTSAYKSLEKRVESVEERETEYEEKNEELETQNKQLQDKLEIVNNAFDGAAEVDQRDLEEEKKELQDKINDMQSKQEKLEEKRAKYYNDISERFAKAIGSAKANALSGAAQILASYETIGQKVGMKPEKIKAGISEVDDIINTFHDIKEKLEAMI